MGDDGPPAELPASLLDNDDHTLAPAPVTTVIEPDGPSGASSLQAAIPAQRTAEGAAPTNPIPSLDAIREAVREVLTAELAPVLAQLTAPGSHSGAPTGDHNVLDELRDAVGEAKAELSATVQEARTELAAVRQEIADLRGAVEELRPQPVPDTTTEAQAAQVSAEHTGLLKTTARVSSASLLCHRDIWEFITAHAGRHPHFRVPPQVADQGDERIRAALSGRSMIALLISLHSIKHTARAGDGDQELATTLYERIEASLTSLASGGEPVTITLDDRTAPNTPTAESGTENDGEPENTSTPPASTERKTDPGEEAGPAAA
ncbi:hypothetical protein ACWEV4_31160 [Streptomyces sp. NPDC003860]